MTGTPFPSLLSPLLIPVHVCTFLLFYHVHPRVTQLARHSFTYTWPLLCAADCVLRSASIMRALLLFRSITHLGMQGQESLHGQVLIGTLAATGGGLMYRWAAGINRFHYPGYDFTVILVAVIMCIVLLGPPTWVDSLVLGMYPVVMTWYSAIPLPRDVVEEVYVLRLLRLLISSSVCVNVTNLLHLHHVCDAHTDAPCLYSRDSSSGPSSFLALAKHNLLPLPHQLSSVWHHHKPRRAPHLPQRRQSPRPRGQGVSPVDALVLPSLHLPESL
jgi:hypothetical protein